MQSVDRTQGVRGSSPVHEIDPRAMLRDAAETLAFYAIGALPVVENGVLVGILSERDVVRAIAEEADLATVPVSEYMTAGPVAITQSDPFDRAWELMVAYDTRHIPIVAGGRVVGLMSARDVLRGLLLTASLRH